MDSFFKYTKYQPVPLLSFSAILHAFALFFLLIMPKYWLWLTALIIVDHLLIITAGLLPRCRLLGANWTKLPMVSLNCGYCAITIDDGPDPEVTPQVLDILDSYHAKATFFCIGQQAESYPDLCREIVQRGHAVENHTQHHWHYFSLLINTTQIRLEIETAQKSLAAITGIQPLFFRPTAGLRNFLLDFVLSQMGLKLASWTRRGFDTRETNATRVLNKLLKNLQTGDILLLHDGHAARTAEGVPVIIEVLPELLKSMNKAQLNTVTLRSLL
jgi:peptidoglycan/xylan/chitin deacetylase (PgdA/CDA1 family)